MQRSRVAVFDLDGTLLNTLEYVLRAFEETTEARGERQSRDKILAAVGPALVDCYRTLLPGDDPAAAADHHHALQQTDVFLGLVEAYADLREMLALLDRKAIKTAILTNRAHEGVDRNFGNLELTDAFDMIVTPESVAHPKPDPEGLYLIAQKLGVPADSLIMIGDLPVDIETGRRAGAGWTVGITHGFGTRQQLEDAGADHIVDSLAELTVLFEGLV